MAVIKKLDPATQNIEVGLVITHSDYIEGYDIPFDRLATVLKAGVAGEIVYQNGSNGEPGVWKVEAGEPAFIACDRILTSGTIGGIVRTTTVPATDIIWGTTAADIKPERL